MKKNVTNKKRHSRKTTTVKKSVFHRLRFLPALVLFGLSLAIHTAPAATTRTQSVLSYATSMSSAELLVSTNAERATNNAPALTINDQLMSAAQSKANDMVARNYWSHNTPDGEEPWGFFVRAGYQYSAAGENLAYGFANAQTTVIGWMNSPAHRDNLVNPVFKEVGFGFSNSTNFVSNGEQTIIVALYGLSPNQTQTVAPVVPAPVQPSPPPQTKPAAVTSPKPVPTANKASEAIETPPQPQPAVVEDTVEEKPVQAIAPTTAKPVNVSKIQMLTGGSATWSSTAVVVFVSSIGLLWTFGRGFHIKKYVLAGETFIRHHIHIDLAVLGLLVLGWSLLQTTGTIR